jgi:AhpC/TSA family protein
MVAPAARRGMSDDPAKPEGGEEGPLSFEPGQEEEDRWAHRRDPDLEPPGPRDEGADVPPPAAPQTSRYGWIVGVIALLAIAYITINTLRTGSHKPGLEAGKPLPPFAVPLATSNLVGDANVNQRKACRVRGSRILNICQLGERSPVVLTLIAGRAGGNCRRQLDLMEGIRSRFPGVAFAAVSIRGDRVDLRRVVQKHHWGFPVGYDRDGAVANLYGVVVCPTLTFAYPGRTNMGTALRFLDRPKLIARVTSLVEGSRARGWKP